MSSALTIANRRYDLVQPLRPEPLGLDGRRPFNVAMRATRQHFRGMKSRARTVPCAWETVAATVLLILNLGLCVFLTGCASTKIDWNSRIGNYTYDQTVVELGPPDKYAKLTDGTVRSEEHTSELQSRPHLVCRLLLEKKKTKTQRV